MLYLCFLKKKSKKKRGLLTSRAFVPFEGLGTGDIDSLGMAAGVSLVTASLSNLVNKKKTNTKCYWWKVKNPESLLVFVFFLSRIFVF